MTQAASTQDQRQTTTATPTQAAPSGGQAPSVVQKKASLRGHGFAEQVQMLAPGGGAPVQREEPPAAQQGTSGEVAQGADGGGQAPTQGAAEEGGAAPAGQAADGSDAQAAIARYQAAYAALAGKNANDPETPKLLEVILGPLGVSVKAPDPADTRSAGDVFLEAVQEGVAKAKAKFPGEMSFALRDPKGKPTTLKLKAPQTINDVNQVLSYIQMEKSVHGAAAANAGLEGDTYALNKAMGLEHIVSSWKGADGTKKARAGKGAGAATFALGFVGQVSSAEPSGEEIEVPDGGGQLKKIPACRGHKVFRRIWEESADAAMIASAGGLASLLDYRTAKPSWCGIFANWALINGGLASAKWASGGGNASWNDKGKARPSSPGAQIALLRPDPAPGDVAYAVSHSQHFCLITKVEGKTVYTVDGNTSSGGGASGGQILAQSRDLGWFSNFFEWQ